MPSTYIARHGSTKLIGEFKTNWKTPLPRNRQVILRTERGLEWGEILCESNEQIRKHLVKGHSKGKIIREVNPKDYDQLQEAQQQEQVEFEGCKKFIKQRKMIMNLVDVEHLFGGERIIFYYLAEGRVDFRELVKDLAREYRTRIEMRQIGVRDEAKLLADYGDCGKPVCCNTYLQKMPPVSMKMAKLQKATLDPTKISGRCGRLKCCLRYEYSTYQSYQRELPRVGSIVVTKQGQGKVLSQEVLAKRLMIAYGDSRYTWTDASEVLTVVKKGPPPKEDSGEHRSRKRKSDSSKKKKLNTGSDSSKKRTATSEPSNQPAQPKKKQPDQDKNQEKESLEYMDFDKLEDDHNSSQKEE